MDDVQTMFTKAQQQFAARVGSIGQNWAAPTPDSDWDVGALVDHLVDEQRWVAPLLSGYDLEAAEKIVKGMASTRADATLGAHRVQEWQEASRAAADAVLEPDVLSRTVHLSRGVTPAADYLNEMIFDLTVHSWDLARALGVDAALPDDLVDYVFAIVQAYGDLSSTGMFDNPVPTADDAPTLDRLIALTGRNPR